MFLPPKLMDCQIKFQPKLKSFVNELKDKIYIKYHSLNNTLDLTKIINIDIVLQKFHLIGKVERVNLQQQFCPDFGISNDTSNDTVHNKYFVTGVHFR